MKKLYILIILTQLTSNLIGQKQANNWALGNYQLDFSSGQPEIKFEYAEYLNRGIGIISDENGALLFYSDGFSVWNKNHQLMPNGSELIPSHRSTSTQESLVIPDPYNDHLYYLFTVDPWNGQETAGLYYSIIDLSLEGGLGDVTVKSVRLIEKISNALSATLHENEKDVWIMTHEHNTNKYLAFLVSSTGVSSNPIISQLGKTHETSHGQMKFSPDGKYIGVSYSPFVSGLSLFEFQKNTGILKNSIDIEFDDFVGSPSINGLAFSSDGTKIYTYEARIDRVIQMNLSIYDFDHINNSRTLIDPQIRYNGLRQMQLAINGNIYFTKGGGGGGTEHLGVISNINESAENVFVEENGLFLQGGDSFVNYTPNFIQNYFFKTSFLHEGTCQSAPTYFRITNTHLLESVHWDFGDGSTSAETHPEHIFNEEGVYTVTLIANYANHSDVITRDVKIDPFPILELGEDTKLCFGSKLSVEDLYTTYLWNTGDTTNTTRVFTKGYYVLEVSNDFGCISKDSVYIDVIELPKINLPDTLILTSDSIEVNPGQFNSYAWSSGENTQSIFITNYGWHSVIVTNEFGCKSFKSFYVGDGSDTKQTTDRWIRLNPRPTAFAGNDIMFVDEFNGFIVNNEQLLITKDQGNSWEEYMTLENGFRISFKEGYGYIIGQTGSIYKSTYHGGGWNLLERNLNVTLNSITQISKDSIFISSNNTLFKSFDGGITWLEYNIPNVDVEDSYFVSKNVGHVACRNGTILKTIDGGVSWYETETSNVSPSDFFKIIFVNQLTGYATQEHNDVYKTTDGGETWHEVASLDAGYGIQFIDENNGFITGEHGAIHKTIDGGNTWEWIGFDGRKYGNDLYGIHFIDNRIGFATGLRGRIIRTFDGGNSWENYSLTYNTISDIQVESNDIVYALVGNDIIKSTNQGIEWTNLGSAAPGEKTRKINFINNNIGFAIAGGTPGTSASSTYIYKTNDGGVTWSRQNTEQIGYGSTNLSTINFIDENIGIVSTDQSLIYKTTDSGISWTEMNSPGNRIRKFQFTDTNVGYAINTGNYYGRLYKTIDEGLNWELIYEDEGDEIYAMHFLNSEVGFLIGDPDLELKKTNDGGATWETIDIPYDWYKDVYFHSEQYGFIFDEEGRVFETLDGGQNWERLYDINGSSQISTFENQIYVYGEAGSILRSQITLADQIRFAPIQVNDTRNSYATINGELMSSLEGEISIQYGISKNNLTDLVYGEIKAGETQNLSLKINDLNESTRYYVRYTLKSNGEVAHSQFEEFETWSYKEMIKLGDVTLNTIEHESSQISFNIESYLEETVLQLEIGLSSGDYIRTDFITSLDQYTNKKIDFTIKQLEPSTKYFIRVKAVDGEKVTVGNEINFFTEENPIIPLSINLNEDINVYPNPTKRLVNISTYEENLNILVLNLNGKIMSSKSISQNQIDISMLPTGLYMVIIKHLNGITSLPILKN